jgi:hypothetical protein
LVSGGEIRSAGSQAAVAGETADLPDGWPASKNRTCKYFACAKFGFWM